MDILLTYVVPGLWLVLFSVWAIASIGTKNTQQAEADKSRTIHLLLMLLSFVLTLTPWLGFGILGWRFLPQEPLFVVSGCLIEAVGIALAITARLYLGRNWSGKVTIKLDHKLVRSGPYALTRHPIYTGVLCGMVGTAIAYGEVPGLVGCALMLIAYWRKIAVEEKFLVQQFGREYEQYRDQVKALIPLIL